MASRSLRDVLTWKSSFYPSLSLPRPWPTSLTARPFSSSPIPQNWLGPKRGHKHKSRKGRPKVQTGGSTRGTTVQMGDYGLRMRDHDRRISAARLQDGVETIKKRLRGLRYRLYTRICADIGVFTKGNEVRMGKGKGSFDYWAARVAVSRVLFEIKGELHEEVARDAFRLAAAKLPGLYEFVKKGDPPVMGITKVPEGTTWAEMKKPVKHLPVVDVPPVLPPVLVHVTTATATATATATRVPPATTSP